ncbi:acyltransferase family protein [Persicitalea jodogahamensis]|uniref:Acyltransferase n=1 Tax=Persicitalea jodogahamensis TaxID=402147 RepID=A0A8J3G911_9BACT|nr:acyltransferase [Persicitalea jodogahamensis]GHB62900.1 acyltransferase [Persicitalea jodogahamensis]
MEFQSLEKTGPLYITRFIASFAVLLFHFLPKGEYSTNSIITKFGEAVNYFFFISGFVMIISNQNYLLGERKIDSSYRYTFWIKRLARIYPLYILSLLICIAFNYFIEEFDKSIYYRVWPEILGVQRWLYAGSINFPGWTISCEYFFYMLFPLLFSKLIYKSNKYIITFGTLFWLISLVTTYQLGIILSKNMIGTSLIIKKLILSLYNHPIFKLSIFVTGMICGKYYLFTVKKIPARMSNILCIVSLIMIIGTIWIIPKENRLLEGGVLTPVYFVFVINLCNLSMRPRKLLNNKIFILLGEISYGLYILQLPVLLFFEYYLNNKIKVDTIGQFINYFILLFFFSTIIYYIFEIPVKKILLKKVQNSNFQ